MKDKIKYICNKLKNSTYSDNCVDYVEKKLLSMTDENLVNRYLLDISILVLEGYELDKDPYKPDYDEINLWDSKYDKLCNRILID